MLAIDTDARALRELADEPRITTAVGDFHRLDDVAALGGRMLDGILIANALHFSSEPERVLADASRRIRPGGTLIVVEYDGRPANPWVPYPVGRARLADFAARLGLATPRPLGERPSNYGGVIYAAALD